MNVRTDITLVRTDNSSNIMHTPHAPNDAAGAATPSGQSASLGLQLIRRQARVELKAAHGQLQQRGLSYSAKWSLMASHIQNEYQQTRAAELLSQIEIEVDTASPFTVTANMATRMASASASKQQSANRRTNTSSLNLPPLAPPSFEEGNSRRQTISTQLFPPSETNTHSHNPSFPALGMLSPIPAHSANAPSATVPMQVSYPLSPNTSMQQQQQHTPAAANAPPSLNDNVTRPGAIFLPSCLHPSPPLWDEILYAKSLFDVKEFQRAAFVLRDIPLVLTPEEEAFRMNRDEDEDDFACFGCEAATRRTVPPEWRTGPNSNLNIALFLRCYSLYLAGEKRKEEEMLELKKNGNSGASQRGPQGATAGANNNPNADSASKQNATHVINRELKGLQAILSQVLRGDPNAAVAAGNPADGHPYARYQRDGFLWYLYGLVLRDLGLNTAAKHALLISVCLFPWHQSAWMSLMSFMKNKTILDETMIVIAEKNQNNLQFITHEYQQMQLKRQLQQQQQQSDSFFRRPRGEVLPPSQPPGIYMKEFFLSECLIHLQNNVEDESLAILEQLCYIFPNSSLIRLNSALAFYHKRNFAEAQHLFEIIQELDPYNLDFLDTYSNILYINDDRAKVSYLAHEAMKIDKFRLQTCCIIGNYYSMRGERERAILYFKRALILNPNYLSAWTLMGHEYVEIRNTNMAIECYRKAIDINPLDYRAWYGLGQTYEILQMNQYAIYYFKKACEIKTYDPRMWCAIGENFEKLSQEGKVASRVEDAIHCYLRAESNNDADGIALHKLAKLYHKRNQIDMAAHYFRKVLARHQCEVESDPMKEDNNGGLDSSTVSAANVNQSKVNASDLDRSASSRNAAAAAAGGGVAGNLVAGKSVALHPDAIEAMMFLADYEFKHSKQLDKAERYCNRLLDVGGDWKESAKSLLIEIRQTKAHQSQAAAGSAAASATKAPLRPVLATPAAGSAFRPHTSIHTPLRPAQQTPMQHAPNSAVNQSTASSTGFFDSPARSP